MAVKCRTKGPSSPILGKSLGFWPDLAAPGRAVVAGSTLGCSPVGAERCAIPDGWGRSAEEPAPHRPRTCRGTAPRRNRLDHVRDQP